MSGDWDKFRDLHISNPERAKAQLEEDKRRVSHGAWGDSVLLALGGLMLVAVVIGVTLRLVL